MPSILEPGKNCWRIEHAEKLRFIVDAADYFRFIREALKKAEKSIYFLCWDIHSQIELVREADGDGYPTQLGDLLNCLVNSNPDLNIYILNWDFAVLYTFDRELLPIYKLDWKTPARIHFKLDGYHPRGASQHQKIVVVDETVAFIGGLDLTLGRWDTPAHLPDNPLRDRIQNNISRPYHDVQVMLNGDVARALGELFRDRWEKVTGDKLPDGDSSRAHAWPENIPPDLKGVSVALSRTQSGYKARPEIKEIACFYRDAILSAQNYIYIENQFFTAPSVGDALQTCLERKNGPVIVVVTPRETDGWLPQHTMDVLRIRLIRKLKTYDIHDRLRVYFPDGPGLEDSPINVHAKVMVVDNRLVTVGSANLNNRSMGLDNECNIIVEARNDSAIADRIATFRDRLLAEHLGCPPGRVNRIMETEKSLIGCIEKCNDRNKRHLNVLPLELSPELDRLVPDTELLDPEHPIQPDLMIRHIIPESSQKQTRSRIITWILLIAFVAGLSALWRWSPLKQWVDIDTLSDIFNTIRTAPAAPLWIVMSFILAGLVAIPFSLLIIVTVITFGPVTGFLYSLIGGMLSALLTYWIGDFLGRNLVRSLIGAKINKISKKIAKHGIINIILVRIVPVAPFTIINLVAGASHIHFRDYILGTMLGMTPGMLAVTLLAERIQATVLNPEFDNALWLVVTVLLITGIAYLLVKWLKRKTRNVRYGKNQAPTGHL